MSEDKLEGGAEGREGEEEAAYLIKWRSTCWVCATGGGTACTGSCVCWEGEEGSSTDPRVKRVRSLDPRVKRVVPRTPG